MISTYAHRARPGAQHVVQLRGDALKRVLNRQWIDREIPEIRDALLLEGIEIEDGIPRPDDGRLLAHMPWTETRSRAIGRAAVIRNADQRDVEFCGARNVRQAHEGRDARKARVD